MGKPFSVATFVGVTCLLIASVSNAQQQGDSRSTGATAAASAYSVAPLADASKTAPTAIMPSEGAAAPLSAASTIMKVPGGNGAVVVPAVNSVKIENSVAVASPPIAAPITAPANVSGTMAASVPPATPPAQVTALSVGHTPLAGDPARAALSNPAAVNAVVKTALVSFNFRSDSERRLYQRAASLFPAFCQDWQRKLHEREVNNLSQLHWEMRNGYETATYTGYGQIQRCECKESSEGIPIGELVYDEINYYLTGKTLDEAKHGKPKAVGTTNTLEIFSWERNKWFY
jgi:hypothetical protein